MAIMNRNVNLEEINTDAFMGISYLNYQTIPQKIIFISGIAAGVGLNLVNSLVWKLNTFVSLFMTLIPLLIGIAFGCNYNEDLTLFNYLKLIVTNPVKHLYSQPTEDLAQLRKKAVQIKREKEELLKGKEITDAEQKKLLKKMLIFGILFIVVIIVTMVIIKLSKTEEVHHTVMSIMHDSGMKRI